MPVLDHIELFEVSRRLVFASGRAGAWNLGPAGICGAPLFFTGPRPISGAPPGSPFLVGHHLGTRYCQSISRQKCGFPARN